MPRGRAPTYDAQREDILARAAQLFAERGYPGVAMSEVARACGVSKPLLYHYVRDKDELLAHICEGHIARLVALVTEVEREPLAAEPQLRMMIHRFVEAYADSRHEHRVLTQDVKFLVGASRARVLDGERRVVAAFAHAIAAARPGDDLAPLHKPLTMLLFGMINWMFTWLHPNGEMSYEAMAPVVSDLFFGGLTAVKSPALSARQATLKVAKSRRKHPNPKETLA